MKLPTKDILSLFDNYSRVARLYPALLAIAPIVWTIGLFHPELVIGDKSKAIVSAVVFFGGLTLLANVARSRGKAIEPQLIAAWGGWRSTIILRHRNDTIDSYTKKRYHDQLKKLCPELELPNVEEEAQNQVDSDAKYRSATKRLIELRRDEKYKLLHKENALYGFRRNLLGLKPLAITIALGMTCVSVLACWLGATLPFNTYNMVLADIASRWPIYALVLLNLGYMTFWISIVRYHFVQQAADEYAVALFRTLE